MKAILQSTFIVETETEEEAYAMQQTVDQANRLNALSAAERAGKSVSDLDGLMEYLGTSVMIVTGKTRLE